MLWKTEGYLIRYLGHPTLRHLLLEWALQDIFKFVQTGVDENKKVLGRFESTGIRPKFLEHLEAAGIDIDPSMFSGFNVQSSGGWS